eukprot:3288343-Pyramimonas_sp.AAC.1
MRQVWAFVYFALGEVSGWVSHLAFTLGGGAGRWWSALALLRAIHGAIWWTTDMVDHQGAVALRGGDHGHREDTCTEASAHANLDTMRGHMRYDIAPPAPPRELMAMPPRKQRPRTTDAELLG